MVGEAQLTLDSPPFEAFLILPPRKCPSRKKRALVMLLSQSAKRSKRLYNN
jgi:hypothetical protein